MKKNIILLSLIFIFLNPAHSETITLDKPMKPAYRLGLSYSLEKEYKVTDLSRIEKEKTSSYAKEYVKNLSYADSSLKELSNEMSKLLELDKEEMLEHIQILWAGAALKSETIKFALYKLANPDADKPDETVIKKIIRPLSTAASIAGSGLGDPVSSAAAMIGGHFLNSLSFNDKDLNYKYTKVTDADMIVLLAKVDNVQKKVIEKYYDYMTNRHLLTMYEKNLKLRAERCRSKDGKSSEMILIADAYFRSAADAKEKQQLEFLEKRAALEQLAGIDALLEFEKKLSGQ